MKGGDEVGAGGDLLGFGELGAGALLACSGKRSRASMMRDCKVREITGASSMTIVSIAGFSQEHAPGARCTAMPEHELLPGVRWRKLAGMELRRAVVLLRESLAGLIAVYEFGSTAAGVSRPESDVDLAVLCDAPLEPEHRWALQEEAAAMLGRDVDLVDLRRASTVMRMQVVSTGRVLFDGDPNARERFEDSVFSSYARLNEERAAILRDVAASGRVHG